MNLRFSEFFSLTGSRLILKEHVLRPFGFAQDKVACCVLLLLLLAACSPSAQSLVRKGNDHYTEQAYEDALSAYQLAQQKDPELAEPYYNAANTLYRQQDYGGAADVMQLAVITADTATMQHRVFYNTGNTFLSMMSFDAAIEAYAAALLRNPFDQDAKYNLELALLLQAQQAPSPQPEPQEDDQQDDQDESEQDQEKERYPPPVAPPEQSAQNSSSSAGMSADEAKKILANVVEDGQTLQEFLGPLDGSDEPPVQDW